MRSGVLPAFLIKMHLGLSIRWSRGEWRCIARSNTRQKHGRFSYLDLGCTIDLWTIRPLWGALDRMFEISLNASLVSRFASQPILHLDSGHEPRICYFVACFDRAVHFHLHTASGHHKNGLLKSSTRSLIFMKYFSLWFIYLLRVKRVHQYRVHDSNIKAERQKVNYASFHFIWNFETFISTLYQTIDNSVELVNWDFFV